MRVISTVVVTSCLLSALACSEGAISSLRPPESPAAAKPPADITATFFISNDASNLLRGDGNYLEGATSPFAGASRYLSGECGVSSTFFYGIASASGDATMNTGANGKCTRRVRLTYAAINADGTTTSEGSIVTSSFLNVRELEIAATSTTPAFYIPIGGDGKRAFVFDDNGKCGVSGSAAIAFIAVMKDGTVAGADSLNVHRDAADTWTISTSPDEIDAVTGQTIHHDKGYCKGNGKLYHIPLHFSVRSSVPLSP